MRSIPARASNVANYGNVVRTAGPDHVFGTLDDGLVTISSAVYNPAANSVTLTPAVPLPLKVLYQIAINQNANLVTGAGVADPSGALISVSAAGGPYIAQFALGTKLSYIDGTGNKVSLTLTGGGQMELRLGADSKAQQLRIIGAQPGRSTLTGQVRPAARAQRPDLAGELIGASGVKIHLKTFVIGPVSRDVISPKKMSFSIKSNIS